MTKKRRGPASRPTWRDVPVKVLHGREKLTFALRAFAVDVAGRVALDLGAAAGGFTTALLAAGARRVYAVDAGYGQLVGSLRQDPRVVNLERTNLGMLDTRLVPDPVDVVSVDLSYLSITDALPQLVSIELAPRAELVALVKPMFELHLAGLPVEPFAGLVDALRTAGEGARASGWQVAAACGSPVLGHHGAVEGFLHAHR